MTYQRSVAISSKLEGVIDQLNTTARDLEKITKFDPILNSDHYAIAEQELYAIAKWVWSMWASRKVFFSSDLIADPGWSILLSLKIAELSGRKNSIAAVSRDSGVPSTTALRWINLLEKEGHVVRQKDLHDARRVFVVLTDTASHLMSRYLTNVRIFLMNFTSG